MLVRGGGMGFQDESGPVTGRSRKAISYTPLYMSFRKADGSWTPAIKLPAPVNTAASEMAASVSPDGKILFFASDRAGRWSIYWIDANILEACPPR